MFAEAGGTFIDTAANYQVGESEETLGVLLAGRRDDFSVATKFAIGGRGDGSGPLQTGNGRRAMVRSVEGSLARLGTDYVDLLWVHFPDLRHATGRDRQGARRTRAGGQDPLRGPLEFPRVDGQ